MTDAERIDQLTRERDALKADIDRQRRQAESAITAHAKERDELRVALEQALAKLGITEADRDGALADRDALEEGLADCKCDLGQARAENKRLREALEACRDYLYLEADILYGDLLADMVRVLRRLWDFEIPAARIEAGHILTTLFEREKNRQARAAMGAENQK